MPSTSDLQSRPTGRAGRAALRRAGLIVAIVAGGIGADQIAKALAARALADVGTVRVLGTVFILHYAENPGAFLGLGATWAPHARALLFGVLATALVIGAAVYLLRGAGMSRLETVALAMLVSGGIGNMIDRIVNDGMVIDFLNVGIGRLRTGVFNIADMLVLFGAGLFALGAWRRDHARERRDPPVHPDPS